MLRVSQVLVNYREDPRNILFQHRIKAMGFEGVQVVGVYDVYTIHSDLNAGDFERAALLLYNPLLQEATLNQRVSPPVFDWAFEVGFLPGVTDNEGQTAEESVRDLLGSHAEGVRIFYSQQVFLQGALKDAEVARIAEGFYNPVIQRAQVKGRAAFEHENGLDKWVPLVHIAQNQKADEVDLNVGNEVLAEIGKKGIIDVDASGKKSYRGPLALDLDSMKVIQAHFKALGRNPTDVELESLAQTWSEHCKHTIFAAELGDIKDGLYAHYIKRATREVRARKGANDFCVSVFTDNSGGILFDENWIVTDKVETHNSPSALDPFGGAITGIVGVNRDAIGFGKGAKPIVNRFGFCFADPRDESPVFRGVDFEQKMLSPLRILEGVVAGVNSGGNCSGIPTPQGFVIFDPRFKGKPLVFVGTAGLIPRKVNGQNAWEKKAMPGDYIVMAGGRVGLDGVHGATFASEEIYAGSPATAVQIGDPITQKKLSDALVKEARDLGLYNSITDNGAGGLSCSVAEMARECNGCEVDLDKVPVKYSGISPWQAWISESQERMTLAVSKEKWPAFRNLMERRGVEATVIGTFNDSGKCVVHFNNKKVMDLDLGFLHEGLPPKRLEVRAPSRSLAPAIFESNKDYSSDLLEMMARLNSASKEFINVQFDHEVQGTSVLKPLQGLGRVQSGFSVVRPLLDSAKGVGLGQGIFSSYADLDTYWMAGAGIDLAVRNAICAGCNPEKIALLDNFCWCSSNDPERLWELERAARACYDFATAYTIPFISGKDSMFNDFKGFDAHNNPVKTSVPPTLLASSIGIVEDVTKCISMDVKMEGDLVYLIGGTRPEMGVTEYARMVAEKKGTNAIGGRVPKLQDLPAAFDSYALLARAIQERVVASAHALEYGGLAVGLAKKCIAGGKGMRIDLGSSALHAYEALFSESLGRILVSVAPENQVGFEKILGAHARKMGVVQGDSLVILHNGKTIADVSVRELGYSYKKTFKDF